MINFEHLTDFNNAAISGPNADLIPAGTIAKVIMNIRSGGFEEEPYLTKSPHSGSIYLHVEFTVLEGPFSRRKIFQNIGITGVYKTCKTRDTDVYGARGRSLLRGIIESSKNIDPHDKSEAAQQARKISSFADLNGITCVVKVGINKDKSGQYDPSNVVLTAITPDKKEYQQIPGIKVYHRNFAGPQTSRNWHQIWQQLQQKDIATVPRKSHLQRVCEA
jgi:hypothetical protein